MLPKLRNLTWMWGVLIGAAVAAPSVPLHAADERTCRDYAKRSVEQMRRGLQAGCSGLDFPVWSDSADLHFGWCLSAQVAQLDTELSAREDHLRACGASLPQVAPPESGMPSLDNAQLISRLYTLPVQIGWSKDWTPPTPENPEPVPRYASNAINCGILNVGPTPRTVEIAMRAVRGGLSPSTILISNKFLVGSGAFVKLYARENGPGTGEIYCEFTIEGPASSYRAGAVIYGDGNPTSHPAH